MDKDEQCSLVQAYLGSGPPGFNTGGQKPIGMVGNDIPPTGQ